MTRLKKTRRLGPVLLSAAVCFVMAGCSSSETNSGKSSAPGGPTSAGAPSGTASAFDACALIPAADISALLGKTVEGKSTNTNPEMPACSWENQDNYESVTLEIGNPGTAPNDTLPPIEPGFGTPGPDGMRYLGGGQVEFAAGNRSNTVQVAVLKLSGDEANAAAVDLARKVGPKIPD